MRNSWFSPYYKVFLRNEGGRFARFYVRLSSFGAWEAQSGHGDDIALYFVGSSAVGEQEGGPVKSLDFAFEGDTWRVCADGARIAEDFHQEAGPTDVEFGAEDLDRDRKSTRLNSSHVAISYAVFCVKKKRS